MGEFEKLLEKSLEEAREVRKGEVIKCKVIKVDSRNVYVDVGYKLEGIIPREELPDAKEGDEVKAVVVRIARGGSPILSHRAYVEKRCVRLLKSAYEKGSFVSGRVVERMRDGYAVDIDGIKAFMPVNEAGRRLREGSKVVVKITELQDTKDGLKVRVSQKAYLLEQERKRKERLLSQLKVGDTVDGRVIKIDPEKGITLLIQGALRAFLPKEELSWGRSKNPYNYAEIGEKLRVKVKRVPQDGNFIFVSLRDMKENPWEKIKDKVKKGDIVNVKLLEVSDKGFIVEIHDGVEGLVPKEEVPQHEEANYKRGSELKVRVLEFDPSKRRLILSVKRALPKPWEEFIKEHPAGSKVRGRVEKIEGAKAIVDLGNGAKGIIHRSDLSWTKPGRMEEVLKEGEDMDFVVLSLEGRFVKLSRKQLTPNPWDLIAHRYKVGQKITLRVKSSHPFGVFLEFPEGVDGLLPLSEIPKGVELLEGSQVEVRITEISPREERITLSMREEKKEKQEEPITTNSESGFTLGDVLRKRIKL